MGAQKVTTLGLLQRLHKKLVILKRHRHNLQLKSFLKSSSREATTEHNQNKAKEDRLLLFKCHELLCMRQTDNQFRTWASISIKNQSYMLRLVLQTNPQTCTLNQSKLGQNLTKTHSRFLQLLRRMRNRTRQSLNRSYSKQINFYLLTIDFTTATKKMCL